jgi:hypothetical protein
MSLVAKAHALKAELGLPSDMRAAQAIAAACEMMLSLCEPWTSLYTNAGVTEFHLQNRV